MLTNVFKCDHPDDYIHTPEEMKVCDVNSWKKISFIRTGIKQTYVVFHNCCVYACGSNKNREVRDSDNKIEYDLGFMFEKHEVLDVVPNQKGVII